MTLFGITFRLSIILVIFAALSSGLTGYYAYENNRALLIERAGADLQNYAQTRSYLLQTALGAVVQDINIMRIASNAETKGSNPTEVLRNLAHAVIYAHPEYQDFYLINTQNWQEIFRVSHAQEKITISSQNSVSALRPYLLGALELAPGQFFLSDLIPSAALPLAPGQDAAPRGTSSVLISAPLSQKNGLNSTFMIVAHINLNNLAAALRVDLPASRQIYLTNDKGEQTHLINKEQVAAVPDALLWNILSRPNKMETCAECGSLSMDQKEQQIFVQSQVQSVDFGNQRAFAMVITESLDETLRQNSMLAEHLWRITFSFGVVALLLAWFFSLAITSPLKKILVSIRRFSAGENPETIPPLKKGKDEIGLLASAVEDMQNQIRIQLTALEENHQAMQYMAHHDPLTGLANRMTFTSLMENTIAQAQRHNRKFAILFIDLDKFKLVNDTHGHHVGDLLLLAVASRMKKCVRTSDVVARLAGDEFVAMLNPIHNGDEARLVGEKLLRHFNEPLVLENEGLTLNIQASIGISLYPEHGSTPQTLIEAADGAMYNSKGSGRNICTLAPTVFPATENTDDGDEKA
ncbi:MAG: diguanylate cyclase [Zoogloeaceae bacterium]|jgi:diguanylate cyclase (GGDEF)-like protein|nr:diguanylate cyclase [Zoogloeaceae bacterium]